MGITSINSISTSEIIDIRDYADLPSSKSTFKQAIENFLSRFFYSSDKNEAREILNKLFKTDEIKFEPEFDLYPTSLESANQYRAFCRLEQLSCNTADTALSKSLFFRDGVPYLNFKITSEDPKISGERVLFDGQITIEELVESKCPFQFELGELDIQYAPTESKGFSADFKNSHFMVMGQGRHIPIERLEDFLKGQGKEYQLAMDAHHRAQERMAKGLV